MKKVVIKFLEVTAILLFLAGNFFSCKDDTNKSDLEFSNIENLYAQPLPVIQKCVEGEWKCIQIYTTGYTGGLHYPTNIFLNITNDSVIVTGYSPFFQVNSFSYSWVKTETVSGYTTYVMEGSGWFFEKIRNDTLYYVVNTKSYDGSPGGLLLRTK